jgi:hypothetical protein
MSDRFFPATILGGRLHGDGIPESGPWEHLACIGGRRITWTSYSVQPEREVRTTGSRPGRGEFLSESSRWTHRFND